MEKMITSEEELGTNGLSAEAIAEKISKALAGLTEPKKFNEKIYKSVNKYGTLDVTASLDYYKEKNKEEVYKGNMIFAVTSTDEKTAKTKTVTINGQECKMYLKAFLSKYKAKMIFNAILETVVLPQFKKIQQADKDGKLISESWVIENKVVPKFAELFKGGFTDYGMDKQDARGLRSVILKISYTERGQFLFEIQDAPGKADANGSVQPVGKADMTVSRFVPMDETLQMAHEILDYIKIQETMAALKGRPLNTLTPKFKPEAKETNPQPSKAPDSSETQEYVIPGGELKGKAMRDLTNEQIKNIVEKGKDSTTDEVRELVKHAAIEYKRRIAAS